MTNSIPEIRDADLLFVIGSNTTEAHPIIAMEMKRAVRNGARLIVADPRKIWMADIAHSHLQLKPGTDVWLLNAMAHVIVTEGLTDDAFIEKHTEGFEAVRKGLSAYTPEGAETVTGVPAEAIRQAARDYANTPRAGIYYTLGITEHTHGTDNVYALANLVLMTGHLGVRSAGMNPLRGQNNVQGANDSGATPIFYPGYQRVGDPEVRLKFEAAWSVSLPPEPGLNLNVMMKAMARGEIRGMYVMGEDLVISEPNASQVEAGLNNLDFLVCQDIFLNETTRYADVILPAACFAEKDGVFTNSDRRVQRVRKAVEPPDEARADWEILCDVARTAGYPMPQYESASRIYDEMAALVPAYAGISHARLEENVAGLQWPCPEPGHPGTETLHLGGPLIGRAGFQVVEYRESDELPDDDFPLVLSTGRVLYHYNAATQTVREPGSMAKAGRNFIEMHRRDARRLMISDGQMVTVSSRRGEVQAEALISPRMRPGCVWMPMHFADSRANLLTNDAGDAVTGTGEYKVCAVSIRA
ncbi:MAG: molybdopterin-dependent oxidoreductase [Acidobacteria bacterium]|uniref:Molybdopterin-dependent oxidoreductase n=1 Tax=Candidatus Polarisedimenticola svalbardensis TaxID=2886004 RepID=A0A8J6XY48_9BACT|nr:molybdopterin-dependent oxidoreductase [Candidatus Polarisedimenticola svalbardensis]